MREINVQNNQNNLLASIAVFGELCNTEKDIQSILIEFIKSVYILEKTWAINSLEASELLKKHYRFEFPEAVIRACLNSLANKGILKREQGKYVMIDKNYSAESLTLKLDEKKQDQENIENQLVDFVENFQGKNLTSQERDDLIENFISYLFENSIPEKYNAIVSSFILHKSEDEIFINDLNQIKEGLIFITGLNYSDDITNLGKWNDELTIFLSTEILFHAVGYNGEVFEILFDDFNSLIKEINNAAQKRIGKRLVHLKFFNDVKKEIDSFFYVAGRIVKRLDNLTPNNVAMEEICKGCKNAYDVERKRSEFETKIKALGITLQQEDNYYSKPEYNIEDKTFLEKYKNNFEANEIENTLNSFTKINYLRRGMNNTQFEKCGHILMTGKVVALILSKDLDVKNQAKDIPFATDIYFVTNRLWYKLNKGFTKSNKLPTAFNIISKAQVVLSSQLNKSIDKKYNDLKLEVKNGKLDEEEAQNLYYNLREKVKRPEEVNKDIVNESLDFIFENDFEKYLKQQTFLEQKVQQGESAINQLSKIQFITSQKKKKKQKIITKTFYYGMIISFIFIILALSYGIWVLIKDIKTASDTPIGLIGFSLAIIFELIGFVKFVKPFNRWLKRKCFTNYLKSLNKVN